MDPLANHIQEWIASEVRAAGMKGAVVGLSGGLDSAVTAALCRSALGDNVLGVIMPCESDRRDQQDALLIATNLQIGTVTIRLEQQYHALVQALPDATPLARANLKPRLRMTALYCFANSLSYLVVGTGNKTELMVGYFTKYGDGGVDILPLGGLYKTQVRDLARELGIPQCIVNKPPSAGLWEGQTDEEELGITYKELDRTLEALETGRANDIAPETIERVRTMVANSAHKRAGASIFEVKE